MSVDLRSTSRYNCVLGFSEKGEVINVSLLLSEPSSGELNRVKMRKLKPNKTSTGRMVSYFYKFLDFQQGKTAGYTR